MKEVGRRRWKKESGYPQQGTVENSFFRFESIIGELLGEREHFRFLNWGRHPRVLLLELGVLRADFF